jgi:hypothetical protein
MDKEQDIKTKLLEWLNTQGYPLEMQVAQEFQSSGFTVTQSQYYADPETAKQREIDVVARKEGEWSDYFLLNIQFAISCKNATKRPWVVFSNETKHSSGVLEGAFISSTVGALFKKRLWGTTNYTTLRLLQSPVRRGYSVTEGFTTGVDIPFQAIMSATKYADSVAAATNLQKETLRDKPVAYASLVCPVVIIPGNLFEAYLDVEGSLQVCEVQRIPIRWGYPLSNSGQQLADVLLCTVKDLPLLIQDAQQALDLLTNSTKAMEWAYSKFKSRQQSA